VIQRLSYGWVVLGAAFVIVTMACSAQASGRHAPRFEPREAVDGFPR
jgi:hypothetical protein